MKSIDLLQDLSIKLGVVSVHDMKAYTIYELVTLLSKRLNEMIKQVNTFGEKASEALLQMALELDELLRGDKVEVEINKTLTTWKDQGIFDELIKSQVFTNFENRLGQIESDLPVLQQEVEQTLAQTVEAVQEKVDEAVEVFETFNLPQFDNYPGYFKSFAGVRTSVIQDFRKVDDNRWLVSQAGGATAIDDGGESFTLTMVNTNGEILSSMEVINGGHGSMFNCQLQGDGSIDIYFTGDQTTNYRIMKIKYVANGKFNASSQQPLSTIPKTSTECQLAYINFEEDLLLLATTAGSGRWYKAEVFNFLDYINGRNQTPLFVTDQTKIQNITSQGFAVSGDHVFVYAGTLGENNTTLRIINMKTREQVDHQLNNLGKLGEETITEAEGIYIDEHQNVYIGIATGGGGTIRNFNAYVFAHKTDQQHIQGKILETAQMFKLTDNNGNAMGLSPLPAKIADIIRPGVYYFTTNEMGQFSDVPDEYKVGSWLIVYPRSKDGGVYQELVRHTSGNNRYRIGRSVVTTTGEAYAFKPITRERKTLHNTDTRTLQAGQSFTLSDSIDNYDELYIRTWGAGGRYNTKTLMTSLLKTDRTFVIHDVNLGDGTSSTGVYFQELQITIEDDLKTFTIKLKSQIGWNGSTMVREDDPSLGIIEVVGIRG